MTKTTFIGIPFLLLSFAFFSGGKAFDQAPSVKAANTLLAALSAEQKAVAQLPYSDSSRTQWSNLPTELVVRKGLQINALADSQKVLLHQLLRQVLSPQGYQKALFIIQYDEATHERLSKAGNPIAKRYGNQNYWFTVFGTPQLGGTWGWKFEGHHLSINMHYAPGKVTCTPLFVGINPALLTKGPYAGTYVLFDENEWGSQLFNSLSADLKQKAITMPHPLTADVMTQTGKEPHMTAQKGVHYQEMNAEQQVLVEKIARTWIENFHPALANEKMSRFLRDKKSVRFTWQGTTSTNDLHYYALQTNTFIIEHTNRDSGIYHYHTLWRDLNEDFGK